MTARVTIALLLFAALAPSSRARAQDDAARAEARRIHTEAEEHAQAGRHALAAERYLELHGVMQRGGFPRAPVALWDAGLELMQLPGREREARDTLQRFLDESTSLSGESDVAEWRSSAVARIAELDARMRTSASDGADTSTRPTTDTPSPPAGGISPIGPIVIGVGVLALGIGAAFGAIALVFDNELWDRCGGTACLDTAENRAKYDETRLYAGAADVLLVTGAVIAIVGVVLTFTLTEGPTESTSGDDAHARLVLRPGGISLDGRF